MFSVRPLRNRVDSFLGKTELYALKGRLRELERRYESLQRCFHADRYRTIAATNDQRTSFRLHEIRNHSQNGEDGILLHIFDTVGCTDRRFFEIGVETGRECNTANLSLEFGWTGVLVEGNAEYARQATTYYDEHAFTTPAQVKVLNRVVTAENVDSILSESGLSGNLDLLSIDVDGIDFWIWNAISRVKPRVVVIEYNAYYSWDKAITVKYDPRFSRYEKHPSGYYYGASLTALKNLARKKGYSLVACDSKGVNAFFVRQDLVEGKFKDLIPEEAYYPLTSGTKTRPSPAHAYAQVAHLDFEQV